MIIRWISLITLFALTTVSCTPSQSSTPIPSEDRQNSPQREASPDLSGDSMETTDTPVLTTKDLQTQIVTPGPGLEDKDMTSTETPDADTQKLVELAKEHLARNAGIAVQDIVLSEVKSVLWHDASLGCPKPGVDYIRVETPGYSIRLEASGKTYNYHTDEIKRVIRCVK